MKNEKFIFGLKTPIAFVAYADPPAISCPSMTDIDGPQITPANAWASKAIDHVLDCPIVQGILEQPVKGAKITHAAWNNKGGLAIQGVLPLDVLLTFGGGKLDFNTVSLCAIMDSFVISKSRMNYLDQVNPRGFILQKTFGGCNPASTIVFPNAPKFTQRLARYQMNQCDNDRRTLFAKRPPLTQKEIDAMFPHRTFPTNYTLENFAPLMGMQLTVKGG